MANLFEVITPRSATAPELAEYEYLICWYGRDGGFHQYLFYNAVLSNSVRGEVVNSEDENMLSSLVQAETRTVSLTAEDLSRNDLEVIGGIFQNKYVVRLFKDGTMERMAPMSNSFKRNLTDGRYNIEFDLVMADKKTWR